jgi:hypothetical protein
MFTVARPSWTPTRFLPTTRTTDSRNPQRRGQAERRGRYSCREVPTSRVGCRELRADRPSGLCREVNVRSFCGGPRARVYRLGLYRRSRSGAMSNCPPPHGPDIPPGSRSPAGSGRRSRTPIVITAVLAAALVAVAGVLIWVFALHGSFQGNDASESSPEVQIKALMRSVDNYLNNADAAGLASLLCDAQKNSPGRHVHTDDQLRKQRDVVGLETSSVADIHIAGDHATARVSVSWSKAPQDDLTQSVKFVRENSGWKVCGKADE